MRGSDCVSLANLPQTEDRVLMLKYSECVRPFHSVPVSTAHPPPSQVTSFGGGGAGLPRQPPGSR